MIILVGCESIDLRPKLNFSKMESENGLCTQQIIGYYKDGKFTELNETSKHGDVPANSKVAIDTICSIKAEKLDPNNPNYFCEYDGVEGKSRDEVYYLFFDDMYSDYIGKERTQRYNEQELEELKELKTKADLIYNSIKCNYKYNMTWYNDSGVLP